MSRTLIPTSLFFDGHLLERWAPDVLGCPPHSQSLYLQPSVHRLLACIFLHRPVTMSDWLFRAGNRGTNSATRVFSNLYFLVCHNGSVFHHQRLQDYIHVPFTASEMRAPDHDGDEC